MGAKEDFLEATQIENQDIYYTVKKTGLLKGNKKIKFVIKPILSKDLFSKETRDEILKELATGQNIDEASRIIAQKYIKEFLNQDEDSICKFLFGKGIVNPKIVEKEDNLKDNELPYSLLNWEIKIFLINNLIKISPIFQKV